MRFPHLVDRLFNTPLLVSAEKAQVIAAYVLGRADQHWIVPDSESPMIEPEASRFIGTRNRVTRPYGLARAHDGVALVTVEGSLVNRGAWLDSRSGLTSYEGIAAQVRDAMSDPEVRSIVLDLNSPGGEAGGMFALAETIREARQTKPVVAVVNDLAASAAYGIASGATEIVISQSSTVGSIGVVMLHLDHSGQLAKEGVAPTLIFAGAHKVDGHPFGPLSEDVRAGLQARADAIYARFIETVAAGRGNRTTADMARATEARTYLGKDAITAGLADRIGSLEQVLAELTTRRPAAIRSKEQMRMNTTTSAPAAENAGFTQAQMDAATAKARAEGRTEGATAERARISAILTHEEAKGREAQATTIALETELSAEQAVKLLAASPKASATAGIPPIQQRAGGAEIGTAAQVPPQAAAAAGWDRAVNRLNARIQN